MVNLGFWQLRRLDERQAANAETRAAMARPPVDVASLAPPSGQTAAGSGPGAGPDGAAGGVLPDYSAVTATGEYLAGAEVLIGHRSFEGQAGSWLATPLRLEDGRLVAVVRGWVPRLQVAGFDPRSADPPDGAVTVTGLAFASARGGRVAETGPGEKPELSRVDLRRFEEVAQLDLADFWVRLTGQVPPQQDLPVPVPRPDLGAGPHLSYAFQWFFFSAGAAVVYALILRRSARAGAARDPSPDPAPWPGGN